MKVSEFELILRVKCGLLMLCELKSNLYCFIGIIFVDNNDYLFIEINID